MARVIKGPGGPSRNHIPAVDGKRVIGKEVWRAQQDAGDVVRRAEVERDRILHDGRQKAQRAREEAQSGAAEEAFAEAAQEALEAFRRRAERFGEAADDIRVLAIEIARKILGAPPRLAASSIDEILAAGLYKLRARRRLRIQVSRARRDALMKERPVLMARVKGEPDLLVEGVDDVSDGFARIVTEVGGALCAEQAAFDRLAISLEIDEKAVAPRPKSAVHLVDESTFPAANHPADFDDDEEDKTDFLGRGRPRPVSRDARPLPSPPPKRARPIPPPKAAEPEATMALDVSELRDELAADDRSDELDLFADDAVVTPRPPR